jgi:hypothetical protein
LGTLPIAHSLSTEWARENLTLAPVLTRNGSQKSKCPITPLEENLARKNSKKYLVSYGRLGRFVERLELAHYHDKERF